MEKQLRDKNGLTEEEFLRQYDSDKYPKPSLTADMVIFRLSDREPEVLLIRRGGHPFLGCWALPGGFANPGEELSLTALRELEEETCVTGVKPSLVGVYSKPGRDPRGWTVSAAYYAVVKENEVTAKAADDAAETGWFPLSEAGAMHLAFDHDDILRDAKAFLT